MRYYLNGIPHYNKLTSSRVEGAHSKLKREIHTLTGDILVTIEVISRVVSYINSQGLHSI
jgi:hypothetical protein